MVEHWSDLIGHQRIAGWFAAAIRNGRLGGSFLFIGSPGVGKTTAAELLARTLLCQVVPPEAMQPCNTCESCRQVLAATHPDLIQVRKPDDRSFIPLDLLIGPPEARMQSGFCREVRMRPRIGSRKVAILRDADFLNEEGANCLLKTLEEPPPDALLVLIGTSEQRQLPTIRSRCQIIRFASPSGREAADLLRAASGVEATDTEVDEAVEIAGGDMHAAARLFSGEADQLRTSLVRQLEEPSPDPIALSRLITTHVNDAGKDASKRRGVLRDLIAIALQTYRRQLRQEALSGVVRGVLLRRVDRCVRALREVDRSANQATLIECFAADLSAGMTGDRGGIG